MLRRLTLYHLEHGHHPLMHLIDRLEWTHHHLKFNDEIVFDLNQVNPVDVHAIHGALELQHRVIAIAQFPHVMEVGIKHLTRSAQIQKSDVTALLRRMNNW